MWAFSKSCQSKARLVGRTVVITGANTGIGKETARDLYWRGARVVLACRDLAKAKAAAEELKRVPPSKPNREQFAGEPGEIVVCKLDLTSLASVRECAKHISDTEPAVHILINNAGIAFCLKSYTADGFEMHLVGDINFEDLMSAISYGPVTAYCKSKLANILFTRELTRRLEEANITGINTYSLHPGIIKTEVGRHSNDSLFQGAGLAFGIIGFFLKTVEQGAQTTVHCAVAEESGKETGLYYCECGPCTPASVALDDVKAARLWDESIKLVGLPTNNLPELMEKIRN